MSEPVVVDVAGWVITVKDDGLVHIKPPNMKHYTPGPDLAETIGKAIVSQAALARARSHRRPKDKPPETP